MSVESFKRGLWAWACAHLDLTAADRDGCRICTCCGTVIEPPATPVEIVALMQRLWL